MPLPEAPSAAYYCDAASLLEVPAWEDAVPSTLGALDADDVGASLLAALETTGSAAAELSLDALC